VIGQPILFLSCLYKMVLVLSIIMSMSFQETGMESSLAATALEYMTNGSAVCQIPSVRLYCVIIIKPEQAAKIFNQLIQSGKPSSMAKIFVENPFLSISLRW